MALVCKLYCCSWEVVLLVRKRPQAVNGGGFVVTDCSVQSQKVVFKAEGCGTLGTKGKLLLRDAHGNALLVIRRNEGMVEALSIYRTWKGYRYDFEGSEELVFRLKQQPNCSILGRKKDVLIRISIINYMAPRSRSSSSSSLDDELEVRGYFPDRKCSIVNSGGSLLAEIGGGGGGGAGEVNKDVYRVVVKPGVDQAFVCGVIAILDNLYGESTACVSHF